MLIWFSLLKAEAEVEQNVGIFYLIRSRAARLRMSDPVQNESDPPAVAEKIGISILSQKLMNVDSCIDVKCETILVRG
jgi:hypothetical protein